MAGQLLTYANTCTCAQNGTPKSGVSMGMGVVDVSFGFFHFYSYISASPAEKDRKSSLTFSSLRLESSFSVFLHLCF
jgi:hypothetical protein